MTALANVFIGFYIFILSLIQVDSRSDSVSRSCSFPVRSVAPRLFGVAPNAMRCETPVPEGQEAGKQIDGRQPIF